MEINPSILFWSAVNFIVLFLLLKKFFWGPILQMMQQREQEISDNIAGAESAREEAFQLKASYEEQLAQSRHEAQRIIEQASRRAEEVQAEILDKARTDADQLMKRAEESIRHERDEAIASLREEVAELAILTAGRVLRREVTDEDQKRLAAMFVKEVGETVD